MQAKAGTMEGEKLRQWLKDLQKEFVIRMTALDDEAQRIEFGIVDKEGGEEGGAATKEVDLPPSRQISAEPSVAEHMLSCTTERFTRRSDRILSESTRSQSDNINI